MLKAALPKGGVTVSAFFGSTPTLLLALCLLAVVGSLPALPAMSGARGRGAPLFVILAIFASSAAIWFGLERPGSLPSTVAGSIVKYASTEIRDAKEPMVLIIDGGSYVLNGVDCDDLMEELSHLGHQVRAVRVAAAAANHFERFRIQQRVVARLGQRPPNQRWVILAEVQEGYDRSPLAQFFENPNTERAYDYATLANAWFATTALRTPNVFIPDEWRWPLVKDSMINAFNAGAFSRFSKEAEVAASSGRVSKSKRSKSKFKGTKRLLPSLASPANSATFTWLQSIRERRMLRLWRPFGAELVYFGLPSTNVDQLNHIRTFCATTKRRCLAPADAELLNDLNDANDWRDRSHMSKKGATIYSRWLARELVARGIVK